MVRSDIHEKTLKSRYTHAKTDTDRQAEAKKTNDVCTVANTENEIAKETKDTMDTTWILPWSTNRPEIKRAVPTPIAINIKK